MKKILVCLLVFITTSSFIGCDRTTPSPVPENASKPITIGVMPDVESIPLIIAEKNDYFTQHGVKVKLEHFKSAQDRDSALQSGGLDGMVTDIVGVTFANEGGIDLKIVAKNEGNIELMAGRETKIQSITDLKDKSVGLSINTIMEYTVDRMLEAGGLSPKAIQKVGIAKMPTRLEMLRGAKVDAAIMPEPLSSLAIKDGARVLSSTDQLQNKAGAIAFTTESLAANPAEIKAIFKAYNDAVLYLREEPVASYVDFIIDTQGFPAETKDLLKLPSYSLAELPSEVILKDVVKWLQDKNLINKTYEYTDLVDEQILRS